MRTHLVPAQADAGAGADLTADDAPPALAAERARSARALPPALRAGSQVWIWLGIVAAAAGFVLIAVGWGQVAGETQVYLQLPYLVSAALIGLGLVMVGLTAVNVATRQRDGADRDRQVAELVVLLEELKDALERRDRR